jgi:hypothetical protein
MEQKVEFGEKYMDDWMKKFQVVETWQVVLDMKSKEEAVELANYHTTQRDGNAVVQVLKRFVLKDEKPVNVEVVNEDWREKE